MLALSKRNQFSRHNGTDAKGDGTHKMFTTDSRTENFLTTFGVKYTYANGVVFPGDFVAGWDKENIGRPVAVREDAVIEYAALMEQGSAAPAPILHRTEDGLRVLDGVQRLSAEALVGSTRISAYIVQTDSADMLAAIRVLANARMQGRAEPAEWTRRRAVEVLVVDRGLSFAEVAKMGGWKAADVQRIASAIQLQRRIESVGGPELPDVMLAALEPYLQESGALEQSAQPFTGFLNTLKKSRMSAADAEPYLSQFFKPLPRGANPFKIYTERLQEIQEDPEVAARITGRQVTALPRDVVLLRELKSVDTTLDSCLMAGDRIANVDEFFRLIDRIKEKLRKIAPNKLPVTARVPADMWSRKI